MSNEDVIPFVKSRLFDTSPESRFASGVIAVNGAPRAGLESEYLGHFYLRRKVYVDQTGQLDPSEIREDGTDRDRDDGRAVTFGVLENHADGVRVVGVARLIVKGEPNAVEPSSGMPLPVEESFADVFGPHGLDGRSCEISRLIARHEKAIIQDLVQWHLFAMILGYIEANRLGRTLAIIEPWLERHLNGIMSIERMSEPRFVEHYLDYNVPIEVDTVGSALRVNARDVDLIPQFQRTAFSMQFFGRVPKRVSHKSAQS